MNLGKLDKIGGKTKNVEKTPEFFDSLSSSISGSPFISGMIHKGSGNAGHGFTSGLVKVVDQPVAMTSLFKSVKKGVQTGVTAAVKAGTNNDNNKIFIKYSHAYDINNNN
jgi:hypothetical protein